MSDKLRQLPIDKLMSWVLNEYRDNGTIFGLSSLYYHGENSGSEGYPLFGKRLELPFGPAAGPHTQLAQNIISGYVTGARFFELKTVQILDGEDLPVSKPCILAADEGYNVEWSTELYVPQALDEYIKAWFAVSLLSREFGFGSGDGFAFNMSVGYDFDGVTSPKIDAFIEGLKDAANTDYWKVCMEWAGSNLPEFKNIGKSSLQGISTEVSNSITLSTLHGCPPEEIEKIASYLLREKGLHTFIKCNPTLLGYDYARSTLDALGFDYVSFDEKHFKNDLQFEDAVPMLQRLVKLADSLSLEFGVKLTNTFPVQVKNKELPGEEMYMSGKALFPLSIEVARRLSEAFGGKLRISYSGGAQAENLKDICNTGISPVTMATTLLKPGGYERLYQISQIMRDADNAAGFEGIDLVKLRELARDAKNNELYKKPPYVQSETQGISLVKKLEGKLPVFDCYTAPCTGGCPFGQDVPSYLALAEKKQYIEAMRVIIDKNPLPHITGTICPHNCMNKCTRQYYDKSVAIRDVKLEVAENAYAQIFQEIENIGKAPKTGRRVAIIGGGPAGLSCAYFLSREGCQVTIFEEKDSLGGIVRHVIPQFRIGEEAVNKDIALIMAMGVEVRLNTKITDINKLRSEGFEHIVIATGAWKPYKLRLKEGSALNALTFLEKFKKKPQALKLGENVVVAGGGNTAIDAARAAIRAEGVSKVTVLYRRAKKYMPAEPEEIEIAVKEGIELRELAVPLSHSGNVLKCTVMKQGEPDETGRPDLLPAEETFELPCDTLISAIGSETDSGLPDEQMAQDVHIIGDAHSGPGTIAEAIADAWICAEKITGISFDAQYSNEACADGGKKRIPFIGADDETEPARCLNCKDCCNLCVQVCPNRANICVNVDGAPQVVHLDFMCNECGNCSVFCPHTGAPYLDKFTFYYNEDDFDDSENPGFCITYNGTYYVGYNGKTFCETDGLDLPEDVMKLIKACVEKLKSISLI